jgi:hypothetical protein
MAELTTPTKPKRKRRWYQYSLRTFLLLITIFAIWLDWLSNEARKQRQAVAWVHEMGGTVYYDYELDKLGELKEDATPPGPVWLRETLGIHFMADVTVVEFHETTEVNDATPLAGLKNLLVLDLWNTRVSDVTPLAGLKNLQWIRLVGTEVSDLTPLAGLKNLEFLDLTGSLVSEEQVNSLRKALPNCHILWLGSRSSVFCTSKARMSAT